MASPWNLAYDGLDCPSGIFYRSDPRERNFYAAASASKGPHVLPVHTKRQFQLLAVDTPTPTPPHEAPKAGVEFSPQSQRYYLPSLRISAQVQIKGLVAETVVTQSFQNCEAHPIEQANYIFPLYDGSVVNAFKCHVGQDRVLEGVVEPKEEAEKLFKHAVERQKVAAMLEEHTPEIFQTSIGSIPPNTTVKVIISYVSELKADLLSNDVIFILPTSIAPRYGTPPSGYADLEVHAQAEALGLEINIDVCLPVPVESVASRTHPVSVKMGKSTPKGFQEMKKEIDPRKATATLATRSTALEKDFIFVISPIESISSTRAFIEPHPDYDDHSAALIKISPQDFPKQIGTPKSTTSEVIFVIDCSGSMDDKVKALKLAMKVSLKSLPDGTSFNICMFGSTAEMLWEKSQFAIQERVDAAFARVEQLSANMGGTEIRAALERSVSSCTVDKDSNIIVITDGETWDLERTLELVRKSNKEQGIRFFCLGIGDATSHSLIEGIGRHGAGTSEIVTLSDCGRWEARVIRLLKGALSPSSWNITVLTESPDISNRYILLPQQDDLDHCIRIPASIQAPFLIPPLNTFSRASVFLLLNNKVLGPNGNKLTLRGTSSNGETADLAVDLEVLDKSVSTIHSFAAHAIMKDLEKESSWLHDSAYESLQVEDSLRFQEMVRQAAIDLGKTWSIVGKWTNFVAVEKRSDGTALKALTTLYHADRTEISNYPDLQPEQVRRRLPRMDAQPCQQRSRSYNIENLCRPRVRVGEARENPREAPRHFFKKFLSHREEVEMILRKEEAEVEACRPAAAAKPKADEEREAELENRTDYLISELDENSDENIYHPYTSGRHYDRLVDSPISSEDPGIALQLEVDNFIEAQTSTGSFDLRNPSLTLLEQMFKTEILEYLKTRLASFSKEELLWPTLLAVVYMEKKLEPDRELLELILDKAKRWLGKFVGAEELASLFENVNQEMQIEMEKT